MINADQRTIRVSWANVFIGKTNFNDCSGLVRYLQNPIQLEDLSKYVMCSNPQISPDAEKICFMITKQVFG